MPKKDSLIFDIFSLIKLEKEDKENISDYIHSKNYKIPKLSLGQKMADKLTKFAGSWMFIFLFLIILITWIFINSFWLIYKLWDPFPFILLNLILSTLAAIQAPIILMSQNRAAERYRIKVERDYYVNRKAEREIKEISKSI